MNELASVLNWLRDSISALLQWLQKYMAGYLVAVLIAARITWRVYKSVSARREKIKKARVPTQPGQAALGAVQEIVRMLEADPDTDWSRINLAALHEHLVDMDEVTLRAAVKEQPVDGGMRIEVSGTGRTLGAIQRIVPAHAQELGRSCGWDVRIEGGVDGVVLTVTSTNPKEVAHIRGLGFIALLASGAPHELRHLAMARNG
jgi:hypothetical protein